MTLQTPTGDMGHSTLNNIVHKTFLKINMRHGDPSTLASGREQAGRTQEERSGSPVAGTLRPSPHMPLLGGLLPGTPPPLAFTSRRRRAAPPPRAAQREPYKASSSQQRGSVVGPAYSPR